MRGDLSVRLQVRVPMELGRTIQDRAKENCRSISQEAEWLLTLALRSQGVEVA